MESLECRDTIYWTYIEIDIICVFIYVDSDNYLTLII
jgi:hypothetical protein